MSGVKQKRNAAGSSTGGASSSNPAASSTNAAASSSNAAASSSTKKDQKEAKGSKSQSNVGLYLNSPNSLELKECEEPPTPGPREVTLKIDYVGICGSDLSLIKKGELAAWKLTEPNILGHEPSATVLAIGDNVKHLKVGDRVAVEHQIPCGVCHYCKHGRYNLCPEADNNALGFPPTHGALRRRMNWRADFCHKLPDNVDSKLGAMVQPMAVAVHAVRRGQVTVGSRVLVTGAGPIGLLSAQVAKAYGAVTVVITDIVDAKLELAKELGASDTINTSGLSAEDQLQKATELLDGGADVTIECTGVEPVIGLGIKATRPGGKVVVCGIGAKEQKIPLTSATMREVDIYGICRFANAYKPAISMISAGLLPHLHKMVTHIVPLENGTKAFDILFSGKGDDGKAPIKVLIECNSH